MTQTAATIPEFVTMIDRSESTLPALAQIATDLLAQAEFKKLPSPHYFRVSQVCQRISLGFGRDLDACRALAQWAAEFGGTVTGQPHEGSDGHQQVYCQVAFIYGTARVQLCAFIPAEPATTT